EVSVAVEVTLCKILGLSQQTKLLFCFPAEAFCLLLVTRIAGSVTDHLVLTSLLIQGSPIQSSPTIASVVELSGGLVEHFFQPRLSVPTCLNAFLANVRQDPFGPNLGS